MTSSSIRTLRHARAILDAVSNGWPKRKMRSGIVAPRVMAMTICPRPEGVLGAEKGSKGTAAPSRKNFRLRSTPSQRTQEAAISSAIPFVFTTCRDGICGPSLTGRTAQNGVPAGRSDFRCPDFMGVARCHLRDRTQGRAIRDAGRALLRLTVLPAGPPLNGAGVRSGPAAKPAPRTLGRRPLWDSGLRVCFPHLCISNRSEQRLLGSAPPASTRYPLKGSEQKPRASRRAFVLAMDPATITRVAGNFQGFPSSQGA